MSEQTLTDIAAQLYALPFDEFVAARTAAAKAAAAAKEQPGLAGEVRSLPKPSVAAWTVNMLAARRPETLQELAGLGQSMRAAQSSLDAPELRRLGQERRQLLSGAVKAAQSAAEQQGRKISGAIATEVEETLRAATADAGAAAAVQSGRLLRALSADGVDVVDLSGAVALPRLLPATAEPAPAPVRSGKSARAGDATGAAPGAKASTGPATAKTAAQPRLRAVRPEPRRSTPSAVERARVLLEEAEAAAAAAAREAGELEEELAGATIRATGLEDAVRELRKELAQREQELKAARKHREVAAARAQQAARYAAKARRSEDLARERVLRLGDTRNTPDR